MEVEMRVLMQLPYAAALVIALSPSMGFAQGATTNGKGIVAGVTANSFVNGGPVPIGPGPNITFESYTATATPAFEKVENGVSVGAAVVGPAGIGSVKANGLPVGTPQGARVGFISVTVPAYFSWLFSPTTTTYGNGGSSPLSPPAGAGAAIQTAGPALKGAANYSIINISNIDPTHSANVSLSYTAGGGGSLAANANAMAMSEAAGEIFDPTSVEAGTWKFNPTLTQLDVKTGGGATSATYITWSDTQAADPFLSIDIASNGYAASVNNLVIDVAIDTTRLDNSSLFSVNDADALEKEADAVIANALVPVGNGEFAVAGPLPLFSDPLLYIVANPNGTSDTLDLTATTLSVPEPNGMMAIMTGTAAIWIMRRRSRRIR